MDQARALRELQAALQLRIDAVYVSLPALVRAIIRKHADGDPLTRISALLAAAELANLLQRTDERTAPIIAQGVATAAILPTQSEPDVASAWRLAAGLAAAGYLFRIRRALTDSRANSVDQIRRVLVGGSITGRPVAEISLHLEQYVNPWYATRRDATGVLRRADRIGARVSGPAVPGMASSPARRVMHFETSSEHGQWGIVTAQRDGGLIKWRLSPWHSKVDECDRKSKQDVGFGPGIYDPNDVPEYPSHRGCRCILEPIEPAATAAGIAA